jgi:hypothetical protein
LSFYPDTLWMLTLTLLLLVGNLLMLTLSMIRLIRHIGIVYVNYVAVPLLQQPPNCDSPR